MQTSRYPALWHAEPHKKATSITHGFCTCIFFCTCFGQGWLYFTLHCRFPDLTCLTFHSLIQWTGASETWGSQEMLGIEWYFGEYGVLSLSEEIPKKKKKKKDQEPGGDATQPLGPFGDCSLCYPLCPFRTDNGGRDFLGGGKPGSLLC